jgi:hypothetical protein
MNRKFGIARPQKGQSPGTLSTIVVVSLDLRVKNEQRGGRICLLYASDPGR